MSLYSITADLARLIEAIESGDIPEEAIADTLEAVNYEWEERVDAVISAIKNYRAECAAIRAEEIALAERRKRKERTVERLTSYLDESIKAIGKSGFESARHVVKFTTSHAVIIDDIDEVIRYAKEFAPGAIREVTEISANKDELKKLLKDGDVPGARIEIRSNIQIK